MLPSADDIRLAIFQVEAHKVLGPDGMFGIFFQHYWSTVGAALTLMVQHFFHSGYMLKQLNLCFLVLLPKVDHPVKSE